MLVTGRLKNKKNMYVNGINEKMIKKENFNRIIPFQFLH
jgi:hypothetical protein